LERVAYLRSFIAKLTEFSQKHARHLADTRPRMLLTIHPQHPPERLLRQVVECLQRGGVVIYPTDTVYGIGCDINNKSAIERVARIKGVDPAKENFACICHDVGIISTYAVQVSTPLYKLMKSALPGPYTFILKASKTIPRHFQSRKKTVGIRVPDHKVPTELVRLLGNPILTASLKDEDELRQYTTDPELIHERYHKLVDIVIDSGPGGTVPSTIIDASEQDALGNEKLVVVREGKGELAHLNITLAED
jgi:tRNA threonylcarbamoyl adenosine modification protein (Sua5/YciO/YrdC/YwlC family)